MRHTSLNLSSATFASPAWSPWFNGAVSWYRDYDKKTNGRPSPTVITDKPGIKHLSELEGTFNSNVGAQLVAAHTEYGESLNKLFNLVMLHGPIELCASYNGVQRHARLFAQAAPDPALGRHSVRIQLDLTTVPTTTAPTSEASSPSLREFFLAALHANSSYGGTLSAIRPDDRTIYEIRTPDRVVQRTISNLVRAEQIRRVRETDPELAQMSFLDVARNNEIEFQAADEVLADLFIQAGLDPQRKYVNGDFLSRPKLEEVYLQHRKEGYRRHNIDIEYVLIPRGALPATKTNGSSLMLMHAGRIFLVREALAPLPHALRVRVAGYLALWQYGFSIFSDWDAATKLMCAHAAQDGRLSELLDVFIALLPRHYFNIIVPAFKNHNGDPRAMDNETFQEMIARIATQRFQWKDVPATYRIDEAIDGNNGIAANLYEQRMDSLLPSAVRGILRAHVLEAKHEFLEVVQSERHREETAQYMQDALRHVEENMLETVSALESRFHELLGGDAKRRSPRTDRIIEDMRDEVHMALDEIRDAMDWLFRNIDQSQMFRRFFIESRLPPKIANRIGVLEDLRRFIGDDESFVRYRNKTTAPILGWCPEEKLPDSSRSLVMMIRDRLLDTCGGPFPATHPLTGKPWERSILQHFIKTGNLTFDRRYTSKQFFDDCLALLLPETAEERLGFAAAYETCMEGPLKWKPLHDIPQAMHPLVDFVRTLLIETTGGQLHNPLNIRDYRRSPLRTLVENGTTRLSRHYTAHQLEANLVELVNMHCTLVGNRDKEAMLCEIDRAIARAIPHLLGWKPLKTIERGCRPLVEMFRQHVMLEFGWLLPANHPLNKFLKSGANPLSRKYNAKKFREDLLAIMSTTFTAEGKPVKAAVSKHFQKAYEMYIGAVLEWKDTEDMEQHVADLVSLMRKSSLQLFYGPIPDKHPITEMHLSTTYKKFMVSGEVFLGRHDFAMRFHDFLTSIMRLESDAGTITERAQTQKGFGAVYERFIEKELKWRPLNEVPEHLHKLLKLTRRHMTVMLGGNFPREHPLSGEDATQNPIRHFVETGEIVGPIDEFLELLETDVFSIGRRNDNTLHSEAPSPASIAVMEQFRAAHAG